MAPAPHADPHPGLPSDMPALPAVVLAGGLARRMGGGDKPLRALAGRPMLAHVLDRLAPQAAALAINANGDPARFAEFGLPVLADPWPDRPGPLAGVLAAMDWAGARGAAWVLTVPGDAPFLPPDLARGLWRARGPSGLALAAGSDAQGHAQAHPTVALWPVALRGAVAQALAQGLRRMRDVTQAQGAGLALWPGDPDPFVNVNTPADLARAEARLAAI